MPHEPCLIFPKVVKSRINYEKKSSKVAYCIIGHNISQKKGSFILKNLIIYLCHLFFCSFQWHLIKTVNSLKEEKVKMKPLLDSGVEHGKKICHVVTIAGKYLCL